MWLANLFSLLDLVTILDHVTWGSSESKKPSLNLKNKTLNVIECITKILGTVISRVVNFIRIYKSTSMQLHFHLELWTLEIYSHFIFYNFFSCWVKWWAISANSTISVKYQVGRVFESRRVSVWGSRRGHQLRNVWSFLELTFGELCVDWFLWVECNNI